AGEFGGDRNDPHQPLRALLPASELFKVGRTHLRGVMRAPGSVGCGDEWALNMHSCDRVSDQRIATTRSANRVEAVPDLLFAGRDDGGQERCHSLAPQGSCKFHNGLASDIVGIDVVATVTVDLQVNESGPTQRFPLIRPLLTYHR